MLELVIFAPSLGQKSPSPFSMKSISLLDMSKLEYKLSYGDPRKAPKKKLPYLIDGKKTIADSSLIQAYLENEYKIEFDEGLNKEEKAIANAFRKMSEEHLYWVLVYSRWIENSDIIRENFFAPVPSILRKFIFSMVKKEVIANLYGQGIGRHSAEEIYAFGNEDLKSISDFLGKKDYFFGNKATSIDATLCAMLNCIIVPKIDTPLKKAALSYDNLIAYHDRFYQNFEKVKS